MANFENILERHFGQVKSSKETQYQIDCFVCNDGKFNMEVSSSVFAFSCWKCQESGNLFSMFKRAGISLDADEFEELKDIAKKVNRDTSKWELKKPKLYMLPKYAVQIYDSMYDEDEEVQFVRKYLADRKISIDAAEFYGLLYVKRESDTNVYFDCPISRSFQGRIIFANESKNLDGHDFFLGRTVINDAIKYLNGFNFENGERDTCKKTSVLINEKNISPFLPIIICEGVFDMMSLFPYKNCTCILGKKIENNFIDFFVKLSMEAMRMKKRLQILLFLDADAQVESFEIISMLEDMCIIDVIDVQKYKDANDFLISDARGFKKTVFGKIEQISNKNNK